MDDLRALGFSLEHSWLIARRVCTYLQYLGIQDAARKRRVDEGPWAGGLYSTAKNRITKSVPQEKWDKAKKLIAKLKKEIGGNTNKKLSYKELERIRGFLCHMAMVYDVIFPYLKGFHLTLAHHLPRRDEGGWKLTDLEWIAHIENKVDEGRYSRQQGDLLIENSVPKAHNPPLMVLPVPRFHQCLEVLERVFEEDLPPVVSVRSTSCMVLVYGFVDASGSGFGSTLLVKGKIKYRIGTWSSLEDSNSSNWREFENLVCEVEQAGKKGWLKESTVLIATDNKVVEACIYKGNSSSPKLFDLIVRLKLMEVRHGFKVQVTHVSGKRMQAQGTDGVSRGSLKEGVAVGKEMIAFCPWGKSALTTSPDLRSWISAWGGKNIIFLRPHDWYLRGHDMKGGSFDKNKFWYPNYCKGTYVWTPPPAAADACLEELRKARMKRKESLHIILIPCLMTPLWLKQLNKAADCIFTIPPVHTFWPATCFEPLTVAILFPYLSHRPFQLKGTPKMFYMGRSLCKVFKENKVDGGHLLFKFLLEVRKYKSVSCSMVWKMLYFGRSPPFSLCLPGDTEKHIGQETGWKRENGEIQKVERKKAKPS